MKRLVNLSKLYKEQIVADQAVSDDAFAIRSKRIGKVDAKEQLEETAELLMQEQSMSCLTLMLNSVIF